MNDFSALVLLSILFNPYGASSGDFLIQKCSESCDFSCESSQHRVFWDRSYEIFVPDDQRSCLLFSLDAMEFPVTHTIRRIVLNMEPEKVISEWVNYLAILRLQSVPGFIEEENIPHKSAVDFLPWDCRYIMGMLRKIKHLQNLLKRDGLISHRNILNLLNPKAKAFPKSSYKEDIGNYETLRSKLSSDRVGNDASNQMEVAEFCRVFFVNTLPVWFNKMR